MKKRLEWIGVERKKRLLSEKVYAVTRSLASDYTDNHAQSYKSSCVVGERRAGRRFREGNGVTSH
jgi:hypothetical protein